VEKMMDDRWGEILIGTIGLMFNAGESRARRAALCVTSLVGIGVPAALWAVVFTHHRLVQWVTTDPEGHLLPALLGLIPGAVLFYAAPPYLKDWIGTLRRDEKTVSELYSAPGEWQVERIETAYRVIPARRQAWVGTVVGVTMGVAWLCFTTCFVAVMCYLSLLSGAFPE
jgi:hypothetical protein